MTEYTPLKLAIPDQQHRSVHWPALKGASMALSVHELIERQPGCYLLITEDRASAQRIQRELAVFMAKDDAAILSFPDWETLPYDAFSPHPDLVAKRLHTLDQLPKLNTGILILPITTLMQRVVPPTFLRQQCLSLTLGEQIDLSAFKRELHDAGYLPVSQVMNHGEFSFRGSIIDLFPSSCAQPIRIELFDDEIVQLKSFDPEDQCSQQDHQHITILPQS